MQEFLYYLAHYDLHPYGDDWLQTGLTCATLAQVMGGGKGKSFKADQFMPKPIIDKETDPQDETLKVIKSLGKRIRYRKKDGKPK